METETHMDGLCSNPCPTFRKITFPAWVLSLPTRKSLGYPWGVTSLSLNLGNGSPRCTVSVCVGKTSCSPGLVFFLWAYSTANVLSGGWAGPEQGATGRLWWPLLPRLPCKAWFPALPASTQRGGLQYLPAARFRWAGDKWNGERKLDSRFLFGMEWWTAQGLQLDSLALVSPSRPGTSYGSGLQKRLLGHFSSLFFSPGKQWTCRTFWKHHLTGTLRPQLRNDRLCHLLPGTGKSVLNTCTQNLHGV